jgi:hypothetical protein
MTPETPGLSGETPWYCRPTLPTLRLSMTGHVSSTRLHDCYAFLSSHSA